MEAKLSRKRIVELGRVFNKQGLTVDKITAIGNDNFQYTVSNGQASTVTTIKNKTISSVQDRTAVTHAKMNLSRGGGLAMDDLDYPLIPPPVPVM